MKLNLQEIPRVRDIAKETFVRDYLKPQRPVVLEGFIEDWPAYRKWSLDYMKEKAGHKTVPLYDDRPVNHKEGFNEPHAKMKLAAYVDLLKREPTRYRIFLWNILKEIPELREDFGYPDIGMRFMKGLPMLFFGGRDSYTFMHYDTDLANILHFHFEGRKQCILFSQSQNRYMYKVPHSTIAREDIDFYDPDLEKWPALKKAKGYVTELNHGDVLFMPEGYWHYMRYITPGFSMSLRSITRNPKFFGKALYNLLIMRHFDVLMRKMKGQSWIDHKNEQAVIRTHKRNGIKV
ncbi:cupin-like domain-containing protein [Sungkyunkwania multivorans]|uniref:Cupin-like domain-containing protein n=1 Tax=Sungkyunkwania multivorans TaxID=1173618 RepID=A0ABW3D0B9_9FLAO